jgi:excisionase family DNA binding protein
MTQVPAHVDRVQRPSVAPSPPELTREDLMTARQVADLLGVPLSTVHEWGRRGVLPRVKLGRHVRFVRSHVERTILAARDSKSPL